MKRAGIIIGLLWMLGTGLFGGDNSSHPWYRLERVRLDEQAKAQTAALEKARAAVRQAESSVTTSRSEKNSEALVISERALGLAQGAVSRAQMKLRESDTRMKSLVSLPVGTVSPSSGDFQIILASGLALTGADAATFPIDAKTRVVTGKGGKVQMVLPDQTTFTVGKNSELVVDEFIYDPAQESRKITAQVTRGVLRWVTGQVYGRGSTQMLVITLMMAVGIRGTDLEVAVQPDGSGWVKLYDGAVEITEKKTGRLITLQPGQMVAHDANGEFSEPKQLAPSVAMTPSPALTQSFAAIGQ